MNATLVIQSHRSPLPQPWLTRCLDSVECWAASRGYDYRFLGDELFSTLPPDLWAKTRTQLVVASDLARLLAIRAALEEGFHTVVWCDADFLIFKPKCFELLEDSFALGREVWVQQSDGKPRAYVKVHNAFLMFRRSNPFLAFYIHAAQALLGEHLGPVVPQFIGPKLLTALHNVVRCPVQESAGMLSPMVAADALTDGGHSLDLFVRRSKRRPAGLNLCSSLAGGEGLDDCAAQTLITKLLSGSVF